MKSLCWMALGLAKDGRTMLYHTFVPHFLFHSLLNMYYCLISTPPIFQTSIPLLAEKENQITAAGNFTRKSLSPGCNTARQLHSLMAGFMAASALSAVVR